jgi:prolipoprotein diacylglyceryl transferase
MLPVLQIGPFALQTPGLAVLLGLWLGLSLVERQAPRFGVNGNDLYNLVFVALVSGVLGARLVYAARYPAAFAASPLSLVSLNPGLLDVWGGAALGFIAALVYGQRKNLPLWPVLDALTPALAVLAVSFGLSHLASGSAFGAPADLPWAVELWGARRHPSQVYEIAGSTLILLIIIWLARVPQRTQVHGVMFLGFLALTAALRLFLEAFRGDSTLVAGGLRVAQIAAWITLAASFWALRKRVKPGAGQSSK